MSKSRSQTNTSTEELQKELRTLRRKVAKLEEQRIRQEKIADSERCLLKRINSQLHEEILMRKETERSLAESEQLFRTLFEKIPDTTMLTDMDGNILDINQIGCESLGYSREELLQMHLKQIDPQIDKFDRKTTHLPWLERKMQLNCETIHRRKDGKEIPVEINVICLEIAGVPGTLGIARDISHRLENEKTIKELINRLSAILNQSIDGILVADIETQEILFTNPSLCKMTGRTETDLRSMKISDLHPSYALKEILKAFKSVMHHSGLLLPDVPLLRQDQSILYVDINGSFAFIDERPCCISIFRDMTERNRIEEMKRDVERIIRQDLKAPLMSINNIAQTLLMDKLHHTQLDRIYDIHAIGSRLLKLINLHNEVQNMEQGTYTPNFEWFDFRSIFKNIELFVSQQAQVKLVRIIRHDSGSANLGKLPYYGEPTLLESMLVNLIINAIEASPNYSEVTLFYEKKQTDTILSIHNYGMVPQEMQNRFFDKYATHGKPKAAGLGTYSARLIAQAHGGTIEYQTDSLSGTTVTVTLPCLESPLPASDGPKTFTIT